MRVVRIEDRVDLGKEIVDRIWPGIVRAVLGDPLDHVLKVAPRLEPVVLGLLHALDLLVQSPRGLRVRFVLRVSQGRKATESFWVVGEE